MHLIIFGLIVGLFSVYNGKATRKYIGELIKETRESTEEEINATKELIEEEANRTQGLLDKLSEQHVTMINILKSSQVK